jgi:hypothetical protein
MAATWRLTVPGMQVHGNVRRRGHVQGARGGRPRRPGMRRIGAWFTRRARQGVVQGDTAGVDPAS